MVRALTRAHLIVAAALLLTSCGLADSHTTFLPKSLRLPEEQPRDLPDPRPDSVALVRNNLAAVFPPITKVSDVSVSPPRRALQGPGWTICVKAKVIGIAGSSVGVETFTVGIEGGKIGDRRRAERGDCEAEAYAPI